LTLVSALAAHSLKNGLSSVNCDHWRRAVSLPTAAGHATAEKKQGEACHGTSDDVLELALAATNLFGLLRAGKNIERGMCDRMCAQLDQVPLYEGVCIRFAESTVHASALVTHASPGTDPVQGFQLFRLRQLQQALPDQTKESEARCGRRIPGPTLAIVLAVLQAVTARLAQLPCKEKEIHKKNICKS
jgi:hypothetical protein